MNSEYGDMLDNISQGISEDAAKEAEGEEGVNWLVALARGLADVQLKFLDEAMGNMETMETVGDGEVGRKDFINAQSEYQANMQMFKMAADMTATSLKSIGEGLAAIARKQ